MIELWYSTGIAMLLSNAMRRVFPRRNRDGFVTFCRGCSEGIARTRRGTEWARRGMTPATRRGRAGVEICSGHNNS